MATQTSKLGYLKDPETGKIFLPKTTWDSIIGKPTNLDSIYDSTIKIRGGDSSDFTDFGTFTLNQNSNADIYIPVFSQTTKGLVPTFTTGQEGYVLTTKGWAQIDPVHAGTVNIGISTDADAFGSFGLNDAVNTNITLPIFTNGKYGLVPNYSTKQISDGLSFLDEKGNWNTALTTWTDNYYIAGSGIDITTASASNAYEVVAYTENTAYCAGIVNANKPTIDGIYKITLKFARITSHRLVIRFSNGDISCKYESAYGSTDKWWVPYNISDKVVYYFEYKNGTFYFLGTNIKTISSNQVQTNWNESNTNSAAYILNKPTKLSDFTNDLAITSITAGAGLNTTSANTSTDGGSITSRGTLHLTKCNNNVGSFGPISNVSPAHGGNFRVPYITVDKYGRVTSASTKIITLPSAGSSTGTIYPMAAYAMYGDTYGTVRPDVFATAFMYPIISGDVTNDCSIITDKFRIQDYNTSGIDGHVSAAALILLYAAYLSRNGFTSGRLEWETHGYGDYFSYLLCTNTSMCYSVGIDDSAIFQSNSITVYTFNWTGYKNNLLPIGANDYNCDATGIGGTSAEFIAHKYIFTFSNIQQSDMSSLDNVLSAINSDDIDTYTKAAELLNEMLKNGTQSFKSMTVRIEHKSVNQNGFNVFHP